MHALSMLVRMGLRNVLRRPQQTVLIVAGLTLSTVLITASFALGDSYGQSQAGAALAQVGGTDVAVTKTDPADPQGTAPMSPAEASRVEASLLGSGRVTAAAGILAPSGLTALYDERTRQVSAENAVLAVPPDLDRVWGPLHDRNGASLTFASLQPGDLFVSPTLARWVGAQPGDRVLVFVQGRPVPFTVRAVLADTIDPASSGRSLSMAVPLARYQQLTGQPGVVDAVYASTRGHVRPPAALGAGLGPAYQVHPYRQHALHQAQQAGGTATSIVLAISALMIGAGLLLIYLVFVVLVAERRRELGMARAVGMGRGYMVGGLVVEGAGYALAASGAGLPLGTGVAALLTHLLDGSHSAYYGQILSIQFHLSAARLLEAFALGFVLTLAVVALSAWRVSRLHVVAAIRNLPEDERGRPPAWPWLAAAAVLGLVAGTLGLRSRSMLDYEVGVSLLLGAAAIGASRLAVRLGAGRRQAGRLGLSFLGAALLLYWTQPFGPVERLLGLYDRLGLGTFPGGVETYLAPVAALLGAVLLAMTNGDLLVRALLAVAGRVPAVAPVSRIGLSHPLAHRFRTGLTVTMFAVVALAVVLVVTLTGTLGGRSVDQATGGYQVQTDSPGLPSDLSQRVLADPTLAGEVAQVASAENVGRQFQQVVPGIRTPTMEGLVRAADDSLLQGTQWYFQARAAGYASDRQVWDAVRTRPGTAVMIFDPRVVGVSRSAHTFPAFDLRVIDPAGGTQTVRVIGLLPIGTQWPFMYVSSTTGAELFGAPWRPTWWAFRVRPGVDVYQFRSDLGATFGATYGMEPEVMLDKQIFAQQTLDSLERFLTGYLALGLVVGVSALGVVAGRAVVERRQQIGVLRAIGCSRGLVHASFLLESGFTAMLGLLIGAGVAIWAAYAFAGALMPAPDGGPLHFQVPLAAVAITVTACYAATLLSTWLPAHAASQVRPAEALRSDG